MEMKFYVMQHICIIMKVESSNSSKIDSDYTVEPLKIGKLQVYARYLAYLR
jgi:hypothetical protein